MLGQGSGCCVPSLPSCQSSFVGSASRGRDGPWHTTSTHHLVPGVFIWAQVHERSQCRACHVPCRMGQHPPGSRLPLGFFRIRHKSTTGQTWRNCCQCRRYLHLLLCGRGQVLVSQPPRRGADALKVLLPGHSQAPCAHCNLGSQGPQGARMLGLAPQCQWLAGAVCSSQQDVGSPVPALCTAYM